MTDRASPKSLTKRTVDAAKPEAKRYELWDRDVKGFGLRIEPSGVKSYLFRYRAGGGGRAAVKRFVNLGRHGSITPEQAREIAKAHASDVAKGGDPAREKERRRDIPTVAEVAKAFLADHIAAKRAPQTLATYTITLDKHVLPEFGSCKITDVTAEDMHRLHRRMRSTPAMANRTMAILSAMFGVHNRTLPASTRLPNPTDDIEKFKESGRERFLTAEEFGRLGAALREAEDTGIPWLPAPGAKAKHAPRLENRRITISTHAAAAVRLLIFTGCRLREILHLEWRDIDFERGLILLPTSKTGKRTIVLNRPAMMVLSDAPRLGRYVIAGKGAGTKDEAPRHDLKRPWELVTKHAGLEGLRLHDLRHSFASVGVGAGLGLPIIGKMLGHTQPGTTQRYSHLDSSSLRRVSDAVGSTIELALAGQIGAQPFAQERVE